MDSASKATQHTFQGVARPWVNFSYGVFTVFPVVVCADWIVCVYSKWSFVVIDKSVINPLDEFYFRLGLWVAIFGSLADALRTEHSELAPPTTDRFVWRVGSWLKNFGLLGAVMAASDFERFFAQPVQGFWREVFTCMFIGGAWLQLYQVWHFHGNRFWRFYWLFATVWCAASVVVQIFGISNIISVDFYGLRYAAAVLLLCFPLVEVIQLEFFNAPPSRFSVAESHPQVSNLFVQIFSSCATKPRAHDVEDRGISQNNLRESAPHRAFIDYLIIPLSAYSTFIAAYMVYFILATAGPSMFVYQSVCGIVDMYPVPWTWLGISLGVAGALLDDLRLESTHLGFHTKDRLAWKISAWIKNWSCIACMASAPEPFYWYFPEPLFHSVVALTFILGHGYHIYMVYVFNNTTFWYNYIRVFRVFAFMYQVAYTIPKYVLGWSVDEMTGSGLFSLEWPPALMILMWPFVEVLRTLFFEIPNKISPTDHPFGAPVVGGNFPTEQSEPLLSHVGFIFNKNANFNHVIIHAVRQ